MNEEKITLMIDKIIWEKFRRYCAAHAFKISAKIQLLLEEELERGPQTKNLLDVFQEIINRESKKDAVESKQTTVEPKQTIVEDRPNGPIHEGNVESQSARPVYEDNPKMINSGKVPTISQLMQKKTM